MDQSKPVFLTHRDRKGFPEWFTLDFEPGGTNGSPRLIISFAETPLRRVAADLFAYAPVERYRARLQDYGIASIFSLDVDRPWGFGGVLEPLKSEAKAGSLKMLKYAIAIPRIDKDAGSCKYCHGTGKDDLGECISCFGNGRRVVKDWAALDQVAATLDVLGVLLDTPGEDLVANPSMAREQLVSIQTTFVRGSAYIGAHLSATFGDYLRTLSGQQLPVVKTAIKSAYLQMQPSYEKFGDFSFRASVRKRGQLTIDIPGDACSLYVDGFSPSLNQASGPMKLDSHHVDGHHQQLALLCGLAALCGMAHKNLYPY